MKQTLQAATTSKIQGRIQNDWLVKVGLADPSVPARTLSQWCRDFPAQETQNIGHMKVGDARDAFAEVIKIINGQCLTDLVGKAMDNNKMQNVPETAAFIIKHIHDEACLGLKSYWHDDRFDASLQSGCRGKSSKVQENVLSVSFGNEEVDVYCELRALLKKDGPTLAAALILEVSRVIHNITTGFREQGYKASVRFVHVLTGDSVGTNDNASRRLFHHFQQEESRLGIKYRLIVVKCASHQANLVVQVAVVGPSVKNPIDDNLLCGTCSRLFKYLIPDYLEEFSYNLREHVLRRFSLKHDEDSPECIQARAHSQNLKDLYGPGVFPETLVRILNRDITKLEHVGSENTDRSTMVGKLFQLLVHFILKVENHPVVTRFFLFMECVFSMLLIDVLGIPGDIFTLSMTNPQRQNVKRLKLVAAYFASPTARQDLRKAALCLQLTTHAVSITAKKNSTEPEATPLVVKLSEGKVQQDTAAQLQRIIPLLGQDSSLDRIDTLIALLTTEGHIIIRFAIYLEYPYKLAMITKTFNPVGWLVAIQEFLRVPEELLDRGYSWLLQQDALSEGSMGDAVTYLRGKEVQDEVVAVLRAISVSSLEAERKIGQDKKSERTKTIGLASASRNSILHRYRVKREVEIRSSMTERKRAEKDQFMSYTALARRQMPSLWPRARGRLRWEKDVDEAARSSLVDEGDKETRDAFLTENKAALKQDAEQTRELARMILAKTYSRGMPATNAQWHTWFAIDKNNDLFRSKMRTGKEDRRPLNRRFVPEKVTPPVRRMQPATRLQSSQEVWEKKLAQEKAGFFALLWGVAPHQRLVMFSCSLWKQPWGLPLRFLEGNVYTLRLAESMADAFKPLPALAAKKLAGISPDDVEVCALKMQHISTDGNMVVLKVCTFTAVDLLKTPPKSTKAAEAEDGSDEEEDAPAEEEPHIKNWDQSGSDASSDSLGGGGGLCSDVEDGVEEEVEEPAVTDADSSDADELLSGPKAKMGTHTVFNNRYFTLSDDKTLESATGERKYKDCKIRILPRWQKAGEMGPVPQCKNARFQDYGETPENPTRSYLVLRAWMIQRFQQDGFHLIHSCRAKFLAYETRSLRAAIEDLGVPGGGTGNDNADAKIRLWAPGAFLP